jgi:hypothetical protein
VNKPTKKKQETRLPIFESQGECAGQTGIPLPLIRKARREGCPAFIAGNRIDLGALLKWIFTDEDEAGAINWSEKLDEFRAKREEIKLAIDKELALDADETETAVKSATALLFAELDRLFITELPPALKGLDERAIRARCRGVIGELKTQVRAKVDHFIIEELSEQTAT